MAAILDFAKVAPRPKSISKSQGISMPKMALLSTWQQFHLADHNLFKYLGAIVKVATILELCKVAPRLNLKVRLQGIIMPKMVFVSTVVTV